MHQKIIVICGLSLCGIAVYTLPSISQTKNLSQLISDTSVEQIEQITSVRELSDVKPTDWAYQALELLNNHYGCIIGYPNRNFLGKHSVTRYELAATLNACLDKFSDHISTQEDLAVVKALQEDFKSELATISKLQNSLEARTTVLEAQQFSTTTKLQGEVTIATQYGDRISTNQVLPADLNSRPSVLARVRLNLNTSFTGTDLLQTQFQVGNGGQDTFAFVTEGQNPLRFVDGGVVDYAGTSNTLSLRRLSYSFKPTKDVTLTIGPRLYASDFIDRNSFANNSAQDFSSGLFINNPLIINNSVENPGGAGVAFDWKIRKSPFSIRAVYIAASPSNSITNALGGGGLFGDPNQGSVELEYSKIFGKNFNNNFDIRLQYTHANTYNSVVLTSVQQNVVGLNTELSLDKYKIFGRLGYSISPKIVGAPSFFQPDYILTWMVGAGIKDLLMPKSLLAFAIGQPAILQTNTGPDQFNFEGFYRIPINDNLSITPTIMLVNNPENASHNSVIQGLLRATFSF